MEQTKKKIIFLVAMLILASLVLLFIFLSLGRNELGVDSLNNLNNNASSMNKENQQDTKNLKPTEEATGQEGVVDDLVFDGTFTKVEGDKLFLKEAGSEKTLTFYIDSVETKVVSMEVSLNNEETKANEIEKEEELSLSELKDGDDISVVAKKSINDETNYFAVVVRRIIAN
jgi:hypothetical protein